MKKLWWLPALLGILTFTPSARAQIGMRTYSTPVAASDVGIGDQGSGIAWHRLTWNVVGGTFSACTVELDSSADNVTYTPGGVISGQTCTSNGSSTVANTIVNFIKIHVPTLTAATGTPILVVHWDGFNVNPAGGGGGGGSGTLTNTAHSLPLGDIVLGNVYPDTVALPAPSGDQIINNLTATPGTAIPAWQPLGSSINTQSGDYTINGQTDRGNIIRGTQMGTAAYSIAQAGTTNFNNGLITKIINNGTDVITLTPTVSTINGASSLAIPVNGIATIMSDNVNYYAELGGTSSGGGGCGSATANTILATDGMANCISQPLSSGGVATGALSFSSNFPSSGGTGLSLSGQESGTGSGSDAIIQQVININNETPNAILSVEGLHISAHADDGGGSAAAVDGLFLDKPTGGTVNNSMESAGPLDISDGTIDTNITEIGGILMTTTANANEFADMDLVGGFSQQDSSGNEQAQLNDSGDSGKPIMSLNDSGTGDVVVTSHGYDAAAAVGLQDFKGDYIFGQHYIDANAFNFWFGVPPITQSFIVGNGFGAVDNAVTPGVILIGSIKSDSTQATLGVYDATANRFCGVSDFPASPQQPVNTCPTVQPDKIDYRTRCNSSASPAVCGSNATGHVAVPTGTDPTLVIDTSAVTTDSVILLQIDESLGTALSVTCNTTLSSLLQPIITARSGAISFTIEIPATVAVNPVCVSYEVLN